jgi:hypothetical protein
MGDPSKVSDIWCDRTTSENEEYVFQDLDWVILDEARIHANTHTKHSKP